MNYADDLGLKLRDASAIAADWLEAFESALSSGDEQAVAGLLTDDGNWRDVLAFTWHLKPTVGAKAIAKGLVVRQPAVQAQGFQIGANRTPPRRVKRLGRDCIETLYQFETKVGR